MKTITHAEMWAKNAFDEWWEFWGFNTKKSIANGRRWENNHGINGHVGHVHSSSCKEGQDVGSKDVLTNNSNRVEYVL